MEVSFPLTNFLKIRPYLCGFSIIKEYLKLDKNVIFFGKNSSYKNKVFNTLTNCLLGKTKNVLIDGKTYNNKDYCSSCADKVLTELINSELNLNADELTDEEYERIREDYGFEKIDYIFENYR